MALQVLPGQQTGAIRGQQSTVPSAAALAAADHARLQRYAAYLDFYNGRHWAKPRAGRANLVLNYSRAIVDKGVSYLLGRGVNFAVAPVDSTVEEQERAAVAEALLYQVYEDNALEAVDVQAATNGAVLGDVVFKLFWESGEGGWRSGQYGQADEGRSVGPGGRGRVRVVNIDPMTFFPRWAEDDPSVLLSASLVYRLPADEVRRRYGESDQQSAVSRQQGGGNGAGALPPSRGGQGDALTPRRGDELASRLSQGGGNALIPRGGKDDALTLTLSQRERGLKTFPLKGEVPVVEVWTAGELVVVAGDREVVRKANPYGFIPFVHIPNARPANEFWGVSDLRDLVSLNRELNERMSDMAEVIRFHSDPPVVFKGVTEHSNLAVGPGTVWDLPEGADVQLLEWKGQAPAVHEHIERLMRALHDVSETPKTAFGDSGRVLSGVALETELQPLIQKTLRKRAWWSAGLRLRNRYILRIAELNGLGDFAPYRSRIIWPPLLPSDSNEEVRNNVALVEAGLRSRRSAMDRLGEENPEAEMARMDGERGTGEA